MRVQIKLFAILRDKAKVGVVDLDVADRSTVAEVFKRLAEVYPAIAVYLPQVSAACES